jgi:hypothetical protein
MVFVVGYKRICSFRLEGRNQRGIATVKFAKMGIATVKYVKIGAESENLLSVHQEAWAGRCREFKSGICAPGRASLEVQRIQKRNLCTRKSEFGGVENSKAESVHQEERVWRCREFESGICTPGRRSWMVLERKQVIRILY